MSIVKQGDAYALRVARQIAIDSSAGVTRYRKGRAFPVTQSLESRLIQELSGNRSVRIVLWSEFGARLADQLSFLGQMSPTFGILQKRKRLFVANRGQKQSVADG